MAFTTARFHPAGSNLGRNLVGRDQHFRRQETELCLAALSNAFMDCCLGSVPDSVVTFEELVRTRPAWTCSRCGRTFSHCRVRSDSVPRASREALAQARQLDEIHQARHRATEVCKYRAERCLLCLCE